MPIYLPVYKTKNTQQTNSLQGTHSRVHSSAQQLLLCTAAARLHPPCLNDPVKDICVCAVLNPTICRRPAPKLQSCHANLLTPENPAQKPLHTKPCTQPPCLTCTIMVSTLSGLNLSL
jgi:hypothetical protein